MYIFAWLNLHNIKSTKPCETNMITECTFLITENPFLISFNLDFWGFLLSSSVIMSAQSGQAVFWNMLAGWPANNQHLCSVATSLSWFFQRGEMAGPPGPCATITRPWLSLTLIQICGLYDSELYLGHYLLWLQITSAINLGVMLPRTSNCHILSISLDWFNWLKKA